MILNKKLFTLASMLGILLLTYNTSVVAQCTQKQLVKMKLPQKVSKQALKPLSVATSDKATANIQALSKAESTFQINQLRIAKNSQASTNQSVKIAPVKQMPKTLKATKTLRISEATLQHSSKTTNSKKNFQKAVISKPTILPRK